MHRGWLLLIVLALFLAGCTGQQGDPGDDGHGESRNTFCASFPSFPSGVAQPIVTLETTLGTIRAEIFRDAVPVTAENFLSLVEDGFYDGTRFHRIISGFMMQGGDPNSKDEDPQNDGRGGPGYEIQDEFHHLLRHDRAGMLSMANSGPNTGGSQFFITFTETPHLDDKHAIFGQVIEGMDVVRAVETQAGSSSGAPRTEVMLQRATVQDAEPEPIEGGLGLWTPLGHHHVPANGGATTFPVVVENCAPVAREVRLQAPNATLEHATLEVPAGQRVVTLVTVQAGSEVAEVVVQAMDVMDRAEVHLTAEPAAGVGSKTAQDGDQVTGNYIGMLTDGRIFDTSVESVGTDDRFPKTPSFGRQPGSYAPFDFTVGGRVIEGFTQLATGMPEGGHESARIPPELAYGTGSQAPLAGKTLIFTLEVLSVQKA